MVNKKYKMIGNFLLLGVLILVLTSFVNAIGVGSGYSVDMPLKMYPGEERSVILSLANIDIEGEIFLEGRILEGSEIASLDSGSYGVLYNVETSAKMNVKVPKDASMGQEYLIRYKFVQVSGGGGEGVTFSQSIERVMKVIVVEKPAEPIPAPTEEPTKTTAGSTAWVWVLVGIVVVVIVVWWLIRKNKS